jgi:sialate O-acetylesterase
LQDDFNGAWQPATPETAGQFSAVGFFYGRYLHRILGVPVGLINNAWGGSAAEAWIRCSALESDSRFASLMDAAVKKEAEYQSPKAQEDYEAALAKWKVAEAKARARFIQPPYKPQSPEAWLAGNKRPGNIFNGVLHPIIGYGLKGVIWYPGESNADRAYEYSRLFPFLIEQWRAEWGQGDFPFYWVQLAGYKDVRPLPQESAWAELREGQTKTMQLTNTGQAVIIDLGEGRDVHPKNKHDVAARLVRWPLVKDYGMKLAFRSPEFKTFGVSTNKVTMEFDCFGSKLRPFGTCKVEGFAVCGEDRVWHWATGRLVGDTEVKVSSDNVPAPIAVRYAWADNPICNLFSNEGLPVTPFRTDDFELSPRPNERAAGGN